LGFAAGIARLALTLPSPASGRGEKLAAAGVEGQKKARTMPGHALKKLKRV
jgi:hypothetical protein